MLSQNIFSKSFLYQLILWLYISLFFYLSIDFAVSNLIGDAPVYQYWFLDYLKTNQWVDAIGNEPLFLIVLTISKFFGVDGLKICIAFSIGLGFCLFGALSKDLKICLYLYPFVFFTPLSKAPMFLSSSWRSSLSTAASILFIYLFVKFSRNSLNFFLSTFILVISYFFASTSHVVGFALTNLFLCYVYLVIPLSTFLKHLKISKNIFYLFSAAIFFVFFLFPFFTLPGTDYIQVRLDSYIFFNTNEVKSFASFLLKVALLIISNIVMVKFSPRSIDPNYKLFLTYTTFAYSICLISTYLLPVMIPDRIVNCLYNYSLVLILDFILCASIYRFQKTY